MLTYNVSLDDQRAICEHTPARDMRIFQLALCTTKRNQK